MNFVISGPSASGKSTVVRHLKQSDLALKFPVSATDRPQREGEDINGVTYWFFTKKEFHELITAGAFVEYVHLEHTYGTLWEEIEKAKDHDVLLELDVQGALKIREMYPELSVLIFIAPPSLDELRRRLIERNDGMDATEQQKRLERALREMAFMREYDHVVVNNDLEKCEEDVYNIIIQYLRKQ